ncbi:rCG24721, isoform CRA_b, partial [Rattus norvegicus]
MLTQPLVSVPALVSSLLHTCFPMLPCPPPHLKTAPWLEAPDTLSTCSMGPQMLISPCPTPIFTISLSLTMASPRLQAHTCSPRVRFKNKSLEPVQR